MLIDEHDFVEDGIFGLFPPSLIDVYWIYEFSLEQFAQYK